MIQRKMNSEYPEYRDIILNILLWDEAKFKVGIAFPLKRWNVMEVTEIVYLAKMIWTI